MNKGIIILVASALAFFLAVGVVFRIQKQKSHFDKTVSEALRTTEGYDQQFIDMVNRLEQELAERASFGYIGGKDPMTGTKRQVVQQLAVARAKPAVAGAPVVEAPRVDPVKLTAIIADAAGKKITAVIMDGERSYSVDPGDKVAGRKISKITNEAVFMEDDSTFYYYDIYGTKSTRPREGAQLAPAAPVTVKAAPAAPKAAPKVEPNAAVKK